MNPNYPLYIVSKGRAKSRLTSRFLESIDVPYFIVVEEQEFDAYAREIDSVKILILDKQFQRDYDAFDNIDETKSKGSGPARNFAWEHSISNGFAWHWVMDDNIRKFDRYNGNRRFAANSGGIFRAMEAFVERYTNVAMAGPNYRGFCAEKSKHPPFVLNTRIYSCNLIRNDVPFRWRGRYNEDTDLSLRMLKAGWVTVQFYAFLQDKMVTLSMKGGNTDEIYKDGTFHKSRMIVDMHPDVARMARRYNRTHHYVDYRSFKKNRLMRKPDAEVSDGVDNFGMVLKEN